MSRGIAEVFDRVAGCINTAGAAHTIMESWIDKGFVNPEVLSPGVNAASHLWTKVTPFLVGIIITLVSWYCRNNALKKERKQERDINEKVESGKLQKLEKIEHKVDKIEHNVDTLKLLVKEVLKTQQIIRREIQSIKKRESMRKKHGKIETQETREKAPLQWTVSLHSPVFI